MNRVKGYISLFKRCVFCRGLAKRSVILKLFPHGRALYAFDRGKVGKARLVGKSFRCRLCGAFDD